MSDNPLSRLSSRPRITPEAERLILGGKESERQILSAERPALVTETKPNRLEKGTAQDLYAELAQSMTPGESKKALNVRIAVSLCDMVNERVFTSKAKGIPMTKDALVTDALRLYFGIPKSTEGMGKLGM